MGLIARGAWWIGLFLAIAIAPLVVAVIGVSLPGRGFATEFSAGLGLVGLALLGLEFVLVARFRAMAEPFGTDGLVQFHRQIGIVGLLFILVHIALSAPWHLVLAPFAPQTPDRVRWALLSTLALLLLVGSSLLRKRLRLSYDAWHLLHSGLAVVVVGAGLMHALLVDHYLSSGWKRALWAALAAGLLALVLWVRVGRPLRQRRRPWTVERVTPEGAGTTTLTLRADDHPGLRFEPGQYAWFSIGRSPFSITTHPFSLSSSAETAETVDISVKALGDFTSTVAELPVGTTVYLDGPYGLLSPDEYEGPGFGLIAGGVGITPVLSMLRTFADRGDRRPIVLFVANRQQDEILFGDELARLAERLDLRVVPVLERPTAGWDGETGRVDAAVLCRYLPAGHQRWQYFICGPDPMMDALEKTLVGLGVPADRIHTERFGWV